MSLFLSLALIAYVLADLLARIEYLRAEIANSQGLDSTDYDGCVLIESLYWFARGCLLFGIFNLSF
jgi:hypothetical protein